VESWLRGDSTWTACINILNDVLETTIEVAKSRKVPLRD
jgi:hypothetical protein